MAKSLAMAVPYDAINEVLGFCLKSAANSKENATSDKAARDSTFELHRGQDLTVVFAGSKFKLRIQHDELGRLRIFGTGELMPMMFKNPGNFVLALFTRQLNRKSEFFKLPGEVRNMVYGFVFQASPNPPYTPWNSSEGSRARTTKFGLKRPLEPIRFLARTANPDCGISFVNKQALTETTPFLLGVKQYHVRGEHQLHALLASMGSEGLSTWTGPLMLHVKDWESGNRTRWTIFDHLKKGEHSKINRINVVAKRRGLVEYYLYPFDTALGRLLEHDAGKFGSDFKIHFDPPLRSENDMQDVDSQFEHALRGESWDGGYLDTGGEGRLVIEVYKAMTSSL